MSDVNYILGKPLKIDENVFIRIPLVSDLLENEMFPIYSSLFTLRTREIFSASEKVDELEMQFPSVYDFMADDNVDQQLSRFFGDYERVSDAVIEALKFWVIFENIPEESLNDPEQGFKKLMNGKIIHNASEWIFDRDMFFKFSEIIRKITNYKRDDFLVAPKITSNAVYQSWMNTYKGRLKTLQRKKTTIGDKILILSISSGSYIPIDRIQNMTVYTFNKVFDGLSAKESYEKDFLIRMSPNYKHSSGSPKHWKESWGQL